MRRTIPFALLAVLALPGCGPASSSDNAKDFSGAKKDVAQALDDFSKAARNSDEKEICSSLLSRDLVRRLDASKARCTGAVSDQLDAVGDNKLDVKSIAIAGNTAKASVESKVSGDDRRQTISLVNENGAWRLSGLG